MKPKGIVFCDTETTGKPRNYNAPASDVDSWPRMVQIGWIVYDEGTYCGHKEYIIKPDGYEIPTEVSKIHGITQEQAINEGVALRDVLVEFWEQWVSPSDIIIGHNISFDVNVIGAEYYRTFGINPIKSKPTYCTMKSMTEYCNIPGPRGLKWPKLEELYQKVFDKSFEQSHTALDDIKHTADCYFALVERGVIVEG